MHRNILLLAAQPSNMAPLDLAREAKIISNALRRGEYGPGYHLEQRWALRIEDLDSAFQETQPQIVHFCGHAEGSEGLVLEDHASEEFVMEPTILSGYLQSYGNIDCLILNACKTEALVEIFGQQVPHVYGTRHSIHDSEAVEFTRGFYDALAAGCSYDLAYRFGCSAMISPEGGLNADWPKHPLPVTGKNETGRTGTRLSIESLHSYSDSEIQRIIEQNLAKLTHSSQAWEGHFNTGLASLRLSCFDHAVEHFRKTLLWQPDEGECRYYLALSLVGARPLASLDLKTLVKISRLVGQACQSDPDREEYLILRSLVQTDFNRRRRSSIKMPEMRLQLKEKSSAALDLLFGVLHHTDTKKIYDP